MQSFKGKWLLFHSVLSAFLTIGEGDFSILKDFFFVEEGLMQNVPGIQVEVRESENEKIDKA